MRSVVAVVLALGVGLSAVGTAAAQTQDPGTLVVVVVDATTGKPIDSAQVFVLGGAAPQASLTNKDGKLEFPGMGAGTYSIIVKSPGHLTSRATAFDIVPDQQTTVSVVLESQSLASAASTAQSTAANGADSNLKIIATVKARASVDVSVVPLSQAQRGVSQSLAQALGSIAGVLNGDTTYDADSAFNISLHGHDASQTGFSLDGVPVIDSEGLAGAQLLFTGASVNFSPTAAYAGGMVNFYTLQPSRIWTYSAQGQVGNLGVGGYSLSASGSSGRFMFAAQAAFAAQDSLRSGLYYGDQSGTAFLHQGGTVTSAQLFKAQYQVNPKTSVSFSEMLSNQNRATICSDFTTIAPCGWGSIPVMTNRYLTTTLAIGSLVGNMQVSVGMYHSNGQYGTSQPARIEYGTPMSGYALSGKRGGTSFYANATAASRQSTLSYYANEYSFDRNAEQTYNGVPVNVSEPAQRSFRFGVYDRIKASDKLALTHSLSIAGATGSGTSLVVQETANWQPSRRDLFQGQVSFGSAQPTYVNLTPVNDPLSASYDCYNGSTYVNGPSDQNVKQSSSSYDLTWRHKLGGGSLNADIYSSSEVGQAFRGAVPAAAEPASIYPDGLANYLQQLAAVWAQPTVCGTIPFVPTRVYVSQSVVGMRQDQRGYAISGEVVLGHNVVMFPNYSLTSTFLATLDPRLKTTGSYYAIGAQLLHQPLVTAGLTLDANTNHGTMEWFLNGQYASENNPANLPAFTTINLGLQAKTHYGTLSFTETNVFGSYNDVFGTYRGIYPMPLVGGGTFAISSDPGVPRQWVVKWTIPWMQHYTPPQRRRPTAATSLAKPGTTTKPSPSPSPSRSPKP